MVSETIAAGIIGGLFSLFTGLLICALWVWRHTTSLEVEAQERINELENNQRSNFSAELAELYTDIEEEIADDDERPEEMTHEEHVVNTVYRVVDEDDVDSVVDELEKIGNSREKYNSHVDKYNDAWVNCVYTAIGVLGIGLVFVIALLTEGSAFTDGAVFVYAIAGFFTGLLGNKAFQAFKEANELKSDFETDWEDYKRPE